jgi:hypothetical protein
MEILTRRGFGNIDVKVGGGYDAAMKSYVDYLYALA